MALPALTLLGREPAERLRRALLVALLLAGVLVFATIDRADPDLWGHVRYGQDVLASGHLPATATFTYAFFAVQVFVLDRVFGDGRTKPSETRLLWLLPPLFTLWANTHGGFVAGLGVLGVYLGCRGLERLHADGRAGLRPAALYGAVALACAGATLVNPYGLELLVWLVRDLVPPRPEIFEWRALSASDTVFPLFVAISALTGTAWLGTRQWRDRARTALLIATA